MVYHTPLPDIYYAIFAYYEPILCFLGFLGAFVDPQKTYNQQAPWPLDSPPPAVLPRASLVTIIQLANVCALMGTTNFFVLGAARKHLSHNPALQEKMVTAMLTPLLIGDIAHTYVTLWALGDDKWAPQTWPGTLWLVLGLGMTLMVPRIAWHLGIGRYVDKRDGVRNSEKN